MWDLLRIYLDALLHSEHAQCYRTFALYLISALTAAKSKAHPSVFAHHFTQAHLLFKHYNGYMGGMFDIDKFLFIPDKSLMRDIKSRVTKEVQRNELAFYIALCYLLIELDARYQMFILMKALKEGSSLSHKDVDLLSERLFRVAT
jgi:hypothetical protein